MKQAKREKRTLLPDEPRPAYDSQHGPALVSPDQGLATYAFRIDRTMAVRNFVRRHVPGSGHCRATKSRHEAPGHTLFPSISCAYGRPSFCLTSELPLS